MPQEKPPYSASTSDVSSLSQVAECFLNFGVDPAENIRKLTAFCGELLSADSALYDRMDGIHMTRLGGWRLPEDSSQMGFGRDTSGYSAVKMFHGDIFEIHHYAHAPIVGSEIENPIGYTYFGKLVKDNDNPVGALSVFFRDKKNLSENVSKILGIVASAIAIEDKRLRSEEALSKQQVNIIATAKLSALGEMATGVAHEINNPLLVMIMRIEHLRELLVEAKSSQSIIQIVNTLESMTLRIAKIVHSLRTFGGDTQDEPFRQVTVAEIVSDTVEFCGERMKQNQISLQLENGLAQLSIECRPTEVSRVLLNLMQNSFDAIEESAEEKWIKIAALVSVSQDQEVLELSVTDSGKGIAPEIQSKIFLPFFTTKDVDRGKGLGLSVAKGIIEKHKGTLQLDTICANTRFVIHLPFKQNYMAKLPSSS